MLSFYSFKFVHFHTSEAFLYISYRLSMELLYHVLFYMSTLFYNFFRIDFDCPCPCPQQTNKNKTIIGCYQIEIYIKHSAPSSEGAVERSETEGEKAINIKFSLSLLPSRLRRATYCPLAVSRFCLCGLERRTKSTAAPTDALFIRHRRRSHMLPVRGSLISTNFSI